MVKKIIWMGCHLLKRIAFKLRINEIYYRLMLPFSHDVVEENIEEARSNLENFSKRPIGTSITKNLLIEPPECDLQIIVPAYNVEKYLKYCIDSIISQKTKYSFKIVLIDDGSTDSTGKIADEYAHNSHVQLIHQENKGFSGARNTGLQKLFGKYIMFVDSDDMLMPGAIESMMDAAIKHDVSIVEGGAYSLYEDKKAVSYKHKETDEVKPLGIMNGFPWGKVFKRELFSKIHFPEGFWFEDSINSFLIYPSVEKALLITDMVYVYRQRSNSITHTAGKSPKCIDSYWIMEQLMAEHEKLGLPNNKEYYEKVMRQVIQNASRTKNTPKSIQKSIFILTCDLIENYLSNTKIPVQCEQLVNCIKSKDFGAFCLYCKTH